MSSAAEQHIVGLQGDKNLERFANDGREFKKIRVVVHAVSVAPSGLTENHVSVYLLIRNTEHSVRINMRSDLDNDDIRGFLVWSRHDYNTSNSRLVQKDYELASRMQVRTLYNAIRNEWHLHRYEFSGGGSGCRHWV